MKKILIRISFILICLSFLTAGFAKSRAERIGTRIMKRYDEVPVFQKMKASLILRIYSSTGRRLYKKKFRMAVYVKNYTRPAIRIAKSIMYFYAPADDKGNSLLSIDYKNKDDDRWMYLKGLRKPKRIAGSDRGSDFMGSDFAQEDVKKPNFEDYKYNFIKIGKAPFRGRKFDCYVVESIPKNSRIKNDIGYGKIVRWIEKKTMLNLKTVFYDTNMARKKVGYMTAFIRGRNKAGQKVYFVKGMKMIDVQKGTRSVITFSRILYGRRARVRRNIFKVRYLTQRWW